MSKAEAIRQVYIIATLQEPSETVMQLLGGLEFDRVLELLLLMRQSSRTVKNPAGFLRRAIEEAWTPESTPQKIDRKLENHEERYYIRRGLTPEEARERVRHGRT